MLWYEYLLLYVGLLISHVVLLNCYKILTKQEVVLNKKIIVILLLIPALSLINNLYNQNLFRAILHFLLVCIMNKVVFKNDNKIIFYYTFPSYVIMALFEIIMGITFLFFGFNSFIELEKSVILKCLFSTLIMLLTLLPFKIKRIVSNIKKFSDFLYKRNDVIAIVICICLIVFFALTTYKNALNFKSLDNYLITVIPLIIFIVVLIMLIKQIINVKNAEEKQESLLEFIKEYEKMIDTDRINRHEMLNNLLILKSFKKKDTKEYEEVLNKLIIMYKNTGKNNIKNLYNLPSGLKGIIYYKTYDINKLNINLTTHISNGCIKYLDEIEPKIYVKITKIIGILMDNAIEATKDSEKKTIILEIYKENEKVIFELSNSTKTDIDLKQINKKGYSTKGKNRGLGLYIVKKLISNISTLELEQNCTNAIFTSKLLIKIEK